MDSAESLGSNFGLPVLGMVQAKNSSATDVDCTAAEGLKSASAGPPCKLQEASERAEGGDAAWSKSEFEVEGGVSAGEYAWAGAAIAGPTATLLKASPRNFCSMHGRCLAGSREVSPCARTKWCHRFAEARPEHCTAFTSATKVAKWRGGPVGNEVKGNAGTGGKSFV